MNKQQIIDILIDKIINREDNKQLLEYLSNTFKFGQTYSYKLIKEARGRVDSIIDVKIYNSYKLLLDNHYSLYYDLVKNEDYKTAFEVLTEINKILDKKV